jgi:uncharacterized radical SAM superfamily Fe-S cluster-containing enzyme
VATKLRAVEALGKLGIRVILVTTLHPGVNDHEIGAIVKFGLGRPWAKQLSPSDVFRITITPFLDVYNFDVRRVMKCCTHHVLPSGHVTPFCAYNVRYREGHVALPTLKQIRTPAKSRALPMLEPVATPAPCQ